MLPPGVPWPTGDTVAPTLRGANLGAKVCARAAVPRYRGERESERRTGGGRTGCGGRPLLAATAARDRGGQGVAARRRHQVWDCDDRRDGAASGAPIAARGRLPVRPLSFPCQRFARTPGARFAGACVAHLRYGFARFGGAFALGRVLALHNGTRDRAGCVFHWRRGALCPRFGSDSGDGRARKKAEKRGTLLGILAVGPMLLMRRLCRPRSLARPSVFLSFLAVRAYA
jgi:hypothetical protein